MYFGYVLVVKGKESSMKALQKWALQKLSGSRLYESYLKALRKLSGSSTEAGSTKDLLKLFENPLEALQKLYESSPKAGSPKAL